VLRAPESGVSGTLRAEEHACTGDSRRLVRGSAGRAPKHRTGGSPRLAMFAGPHDQLAGPLVVANHCAAA